MVRSFLWISTLNSFKASLSLVLMSQHHPLVLPLPAVYLLNVVKDSDHLVS